MPRAKASILLIESDQRILNAIVSHAQQNHYLVEQAHDILSGIDLAANNDYDLIITNASLHNGNGEFFCKQIRKKCGLTIPIIMILSKHIIESDMANLECGASDYIITPFTSHELKLRIKSQLKKYRYSPTQNMLIDDLQLDFNTRSATRKNISVPLTPTAFKILSLLMHSSPAIVQHREIEKHIWGKEIPNSDALRSHIYNLRKIIDKPFKKKLIKTHQRTGYQIVA